MQHTTYEHHSFSREVLIDIALIFIALVCAAFIHELGHFTLATFYNLEPRFGVDTAHLYVKSLTPDSLYQQRIIEAGGALFNLIAGIIFLFVILVKLPDRERFTKQSSFILTLLFTTNLLVGIVTLVLEVILRIS